jgi:hypothetical protein
MIYKNNLFRLSLVLTITLFFNKGYSQELSIEDLLNFKNLNKQSLEIYLTNKGYNLDEYISNESGDDSKSYKIYEFLDRIHYSNLTFHVNKNASISRISYAFNKNLSYNNLVTQIKNLKFKLLGHYEGDFGTDIYVYGKEKLEISAFEQPEGPMSSCETCTYYNIEITFK